MAQQETVLTMKEVEEEVKDWQIQLQTAQAAIDDYGRNIGQLALDVGVDAAVETEIRLGVQVKRAAAGLQAAKTRRDIVRRQEQQEYALQLRAEADTLEREAAAHSAFLDEWGPQVEAARQALEGKSYAAQRNRDYAAEIERRLREELTP